MEVSEIKKYASYGHKPEEHLDMNEELLWYKLRDLYHQRKAGLIQETAFKTALQAHIAEYRQNSTRIYFNERIREEDAKRWKSIEQLVSNYRLNPSVSLADDVLNTLYGLEEHNHV